MDIKNASAEAEAKLFHNLTLLPLPNPLNPTGGPRQKTHPPAFYSGFSGARADVTSAKGRIAQVTAERKNFEIAEQQWKDARANTRDQSGRRENQRSLKALQHESPPPTDEVAKADDRSSK